MKILRLLRRELPQTVLLALPFALAAAWWNRIPPTVVTHWGIHGQPNGWMPKLPGLLIAPVFNVGLCLLLAWLPRIDPRLRRDPSAHTARYRQTLRAVRLALTGFLALAAVMVIAVAAGWRLNVGALVYYGALALLAVLGNFFSRLQRNYFLGIRTPWTLDDDATWRATHRFAGRFTVFGALALLVAGPFVSTTIQAVLLCGFVLALACASVAYSLWYYQHRQPGGDSPHPAA